MDKTTFVFGAPSESEEGKLVKIFSRLSLSLLLSLFFLIFILGGWGALIFLNANLKSSLEFYKSKASSIYAKMNQDGEMKKAIEFINDIDKRISLASLILETHTNAYALLEFLQTYTLPTVYYKKAQFISGRIKTAPTIKKEFDNLKKKITDLKDMIKNNSLASSLDTLYGKLTEVSGLPKKNLIELVKAILADLQDKEKNPLESDETRNLANEIVNLANNLAQKLSVGESFRIEGETVDFNTVAKQIVTFKKAIRKPFMNQNEETVENITVGMLNLTQDGRVSFTMDIVINPNYLLAQ